MSSGAVDAQADPVPIAQERVDRRQGRVAADASSITVVEAQLVVESAAGHVDLRPVVPAGRAIGAVEPPLPAESGQPAFVGPVVLEVSEDFVGRVDLADPPLTPSQNIGGGAGPTHQVVFGVGGRLLGVLPLPAPLVVDHRRVFTRFGGRNDVRQQGVLGRIGGELTQFVRIVLVGKPNRQRRDRHHLPFFQQFQAQAIERLWPAPTARSRLMAKGPREGIEKPPGLQVGKTM